ncbi:MAG: hypothetical protein LBS54_02675 [Dysgonamonadaceae bacterium]|jgi:hypothetical protein|nr:hypothetical protein [Dysgonamonadaceae bacterium]
MKSKNNKKNQRAYTPIPHKETKKFVDSIDMAKTYSHAAIVNFRALNASNDKAILDFHKLLLYVETTKLYNKEAEEYNQEVTLEKSEIIDYIDKIEQHFNIMNPDAVELQEIITRTQDYVNTLSPDVEGNDKMIEILQTTINDSQKTLDGMLGYIKDMGLCIEEMKNHMKDSE